MPTPTGTIAMSDVNVELGKSSTATISLNDSDVRALAGVSSGAISMDNLRGKSSASAAISSLYAQNFSRVAIGGTATARYRLYSNGQAYRTSLNGTVVSISGEWLVAGSSSQFEAYATWSGSPIGVTGPTGSWVSLGTDREWTLTATNTYYGATLSVQIRLASSGTVLDTATISFEVDSAP